MFKSAVNSLEKSPKYNKVTDLPRSSLGGPGLLLLLDLLGGWSLKGERPVLPLVDQSSADIGAAPKPASWVGMLMPAGAMSDCQAEG